MIKKLEGEITLVIILEKINEIIHTLNSMEDIINFFRNSATSQRQSYEIVWSCLCNGFPLFLFWKKGLVF